MSIETSFGRALLAIQATRESGEIIITARSKNGELVARESIKINVD